MGKPAARLTDMHTCPMVTGLVPHVGGPVTAPGVPTVLVGFLPAAVVGDMCVCVGPPDAIAMGSPTVFIGGKMAARMGDPTVHGGVIVVGCPTVLIGEVGSGGAGGGGGGDDKEDKSILETLSSWISSFFESPETKGSRVVGMDADKADEAINQALKNQRLLLEAKKKELEKWDDNAKANFKKAFGSESEENRNKIQARIDRMLELNKSMTLENFKIADPPDPKKQRFAYVIPSNNDHIVYLDISFGTAQDTGEDSRAGALAHEMSHLNDIGGTKDKFIGINNDEPIYGLTASRQLAVEHPELAIQHADSFEYYVENVP